MQGVCTQIGCVRLVSSRFGPTLCLQARCGLVGPTRCPRAARGPAPTPPLDTLFRLWAERLGAAVIFGSAAKTFTPKKLSCATVTPGEAVRSSGVKRGASPDLGSAVEATASSNCSSTSATVEAKPTAVPTSSSSFPTLIQQKAKTNHRRKQSPIVIVSTSFNTRVERLETSSFDTLFFVRNCWFALKYALRCIRHLIKVTCALLPVWGCAMLMSPVWACCVFTLFTFWDQWREQCFRPNIMLSFILSNLTTVTCIVGLLLLLVSDPQAELPTFEFNVAQGRSEGPTCL